MTNLGAKPKVRCWINAMYLILDKKHRCMQMGFACKPAAIEQSGVQINTQTLFASDDERTFSCNVPLIFDSLILKPIHYRFVFKKESLFRLTYKALGRAVKMYRAIHPVTSRMFSSIDQFRSAIATCLLIAIFVHAFFIWDTNQKVKTAPIVQKSFSFNEAMEYLQSSKIAAKIDSEKHAFVASDAFYFGSSKGYLTIPITAHISNDYSAKPVVIITRAKNGMSIVQKNLRAPIKNSSCDKSGLTVYLFDGASKLIVFQNATPEKLQRRFVLTEAVENLSAAESLCEEYSALVDHFDEL